MSEVKYRVYDTKSGQMLPVTAIYHMQSPTRRAVQVIGKVPMAHRSYSAVTDKLIGSRGILMQYTGLKDTNGVEIYEGDIVRDLEFDSDTYNCRNTIVFEQGSFRSGTGSSGDWLRAFANTNLEVIGNIHQNPELLDV